MLDYLIQNASVIDGTGAPARKMDVGIRNGKIVLGGGESAEVTIDAGGKTLAPGFIDVHAHTDLFAFADPLCGAKLAQGITTEICGQCGLSPAPTAAAHMQEYVGYYKHQGAPIYRNEDGIRRVLYLIESF